MKRLLYLLPLLLFVACGGDDDGAGTPDTPSNQTPPPTQQGMLTCTITAPKQGAEINPQQAMEIKGEAKAEGCTVGTVQLRVGGRLIGSVSAVPFTYSYTFAENQPNGTLNIALSVMSEDRKLSASDAVSVQIKRPNTQQMPVGVTCVVAQDGTGDFTKVQDAINSLKTNQSERQIIYIKAGTYHEKMTVESNKTNIALVGEDAATTILTYDDHSGRKDASGNEIGTQNSASFTIKATGFLAQHITFANLHVNNTGSGDQAVAVGVYNDRAAFYNCRLVGYQDTFYVKNSARVYCKDCYIEGNVDFIFGDAVLLCEKCQLHCNRDGSVITAAAEHTDCQYGYTFIDCKLTHIEGKDFNGKEFRNFHLGRPWKQNARVVYIRCDEPATLHPAAWRRMSEGVDAALFAEYKCTGAGATADRLAQREMGGRQLTDEEAATYTLEKIFSKQCRPSKYTADWIPEGKIAMQ